MKTALIGLGRMGRRHLQIIRELALDLVGVCDQHAPTVAAAGVECGIPETSRFTDARVMLAATRPEAVIIATTAPTHCEFTCAAAEAGAKFILCEKPMAVSLAECDRMIATCARHGARLAVNHQMRFMAQYTEPKRLAQSEAFGGLRSVTVVAGNFGLAMNGSHYFEMFRFLTDEPPAMVTAWFSPEVVPNPRGPQFEDRAGCVRVTTAGGRRLYLDCSADQGHGMHVVYAGPFGRMEVDELTGVLHSAVREPAHRVLPTTRYGMPWIEHTEKIAPADAVAPTRAVLRAVLRGEDPPTGEAGRLAVATLIAAYVSHEQGGSAVAVDAALPHDRVFPWA